MVEGYPKRIDACNFKQSYSTRFSQNTPLHQGAPRYDNTEDVLNKLLKEDLEKIKKDMFNEQADEFAKAVDPALAEKFRSKDPN